MINVYICILEETEEMHLSSAASFLYIEVNLLCVLICGVILIRCLRSIDKRRKARYFCSMTICFEINFLCDLVWRIIDNHHASTPISLNYLINCLYFSAGTLGCYFWFMYAEISQGGWASRRQRNAWLVLLPALGLIGITIASCRTGWVFSIDENNRYLRGPLHLWQLGLSFAYVLLTSAKALCKAFQKKHFERRMELLSLAAFMLLPLGFVLLQVIYLGQVPTLCMGYTVTLLVVYLNILDQRITIDPLTQVYNREQMVRYLSHKLRSAGKDSSLFLLMLDADNFKHINDRYGHTIGDEVIRFVADTIRTKVDDRGGFAGRFGGDEFVLCFTNPDDIANIENISMDIINELYEGYTTADGAMHIDVKASIGVAFCPEHTEDVNELLSFADTAMYFVKKNGKTNYHIYIPEDSATDEYIDPEGF